MSADVPGWVEARCGDLITRIEAGKSFKCDERRPSSSEVAVLKVSAVSWGTYDELESKTCTDATRIDPMLFVQRGDFLFSRANTIELVGACVIADQVTRSAMLSDKILRLTLAEIPPKWLLYALRSAGGRREIERLATGNQESMRNIGQERIRQIAILLPPLAEQHRIVAAIEEQISRVDAGVLALERVKKELARYRASVLNAACEGRLVPTEAALARAEGRSYEPASDLLTRILAERRARWDRKKKYAEPAAPHASSLPALPEGWVWGTVEQISWDSGYGTSQKCDYDGRGIPVLRIPNVSQARIDLADLKRVVRREEAVEESELVVPGDLLVVRTNGSRDLIGRAAVAEVPLATSCSFASYLIRFRLCGNATTWKFTSLYWQAPDNRRDLEARAATSAGQYNISQTKLASIAIPLPPLAEQHRIVAEVERRLSIADEVAATVESALARAARLRQSILKRAFEGKLVPQDPNDEPASALLARIRAERERAERAQPRPPRRVKT